MIRPRWGSRRAKAASLQLFLVVLMIALCAYSLGIGQFPIPVWTVVRIVAALARHAMTGAAIQGDWTQTQTVIIELVRLPRVFIALISGMGLGLCGATLQGLLRNPLVGPEIAGVSHGAAFGGVVAIVLGLSTLGIVGSAFLGAVAALSASFGLARLAGGANILSLVLSGMIVGAFFAACIGVAEYTADPDTKLPSIVYWLLGSFANADWTRLATIAPPFAVGGFLLFGLRWRINLLSLGETDAASLGVKVERLRWLIVVLVALIVAAQVAVSGDVGWVGLVIPHIARMIGGADHRGLLPLSALVGGIYLLAMDDIARTATAQEIPIGLLTALVGTPIFAILFWKQQNRGWRRE